AYSVTDPSGLSAAGTATLAVAAGPAVSPDGSVLLAGPGGSLVTTDGTWTFSTTTAAGGYEILLNGQWAGGGSAVKLEVANQGHLYADNSQANWYEWVGGAWTPCASPVLTTSPASLTVAENSGSTPIGIVAPTDPNYAASQLSVSVTGLPTDGSVLLSDGVTQVSTGETLTVAQLTGLEFEPTAGTFGQSSNFAYSVTDPSGFSAAGTATLAIGAGPAVSPD